MLEFQAHICWVITVDYEFRLGRGNSEFDRKIPKLTLSVRFPVKSNSVHISEAGGKIRTDMGSFYIRRSPLVVDCRQGLCVLAAISLCIEATAGFLSVPRLL